ncbi:hypothetical protein PMI31_00233 [Pseudomonas sp. GM55]|nr:hypothetical protein PMI31_00233 [Pseudomonas sp. GM55]
MKLFLDCEFTQLNQDTKLISLALVSEVGDEFYVELNRPGVGNDDSIVNLQLNLTQTVISKKYFSSTLKNAFKPSD